MYCPVCGKENSEGRRFCRSCGLSLEGIAGTASELGAIPTQDGSVQPVSRVQAAWQNPFIYALFLILLGIVIGAVGKSVLSSEITADIGTIIALLGVGLLGLKGVLLVVAPPRNVPPARSTVKAADPARSNPVLLSAEPPSVTENTTRELDASLDSRAKKPRDTQPTQ